VTDGVSNLHPRINEVLMKERMKIIEDSRCSISYFEDVSFVCRKIWT
jgi:GTP:adenosylcobinamide-phosphate guanylyltransferase